MAEPRPSASASQLFTTESDNLPSSDEHRHNGLIQSQINQPSSAPQLDGYMPGILQTRLMDSMERVIKIGYDDDDDFAVPEYIAPSHSNSQINIGAETVVPSSPSSNFQAINLENYYGKDSKSVCPLTISTPSHAGHGDLKGHLSDDNSVDTISDPFGTMMTDKSQEVLKKFEYFGQHLNDETVIQSCTDMSLTKDVDCESRFVYYSEGGKEHKSTTRSSFGMEGDSFMMESNVDGESNMPKTAVTRYLFDITISPDDVIRLIGPKHFWKTRMTIANQQRVFRDQLFELHRLIKVQKMFATTPHHLLQGHGITALGNSLPSNPSLPTEPVSLNPLRGGMRVSSEYSSCGVQPADGNPTMSWGRGDPPVYPGLVPVMSPTEGLVYKPISRSDGGPSGASVGPSAASLRIPPCRLPSDHSFGALPPFPPSPIQVFGPSSLTRYEKEHSTYGGGPGMKGKAREEGNTVLRAGPPPTVVTCGEPGDVVVAQQSSPFRTTKGDPSGSTQLDVGKRLQFLNPYKRRE